MLVYLKCTLRPVDDNNTAVCRVLCCCIDRSCRFSPYTAALLLYMLPALLVLASGVHRTFVAWGVLPFKMLPAIDMVLSSLVKPPFTILSPTPCVR